MKKFLIIQARFYENISDLLLDGAVEELKKNNIQYDIIDVLGALEIAPAIAMAEKSRQYDAFVALGCVIRGETSHYDIVAGESARAISELSVHKKIAIGNGILTTENEQQAIARADKFKKNKGGFAVKACLELISIKERFHKPFKHHNQKKKTILSFFKK
jgi:6,7-dimethyl-8-ribityllumazine synthase